MNDWKRLQLREICAEISYGYTASATDQNTGIKFLRITDIVNSPFDWGTVPFCVISEKDSVKYRLEEGDIVIARTGATTGTTFAFKSDVPTVFASYLIRYKLNKAIANPFFVGYNLRSDNWRGFVENIIGGSAQPGANAQQFGSYDIFLPSLQEQNAITEILTSLDDKIDLLHRNNKTLEQLAETIFRQWFVIEGSDDWEISTLGKVFDVGIGRTPPRNQHQWFTKNSSDLKWVSIKDMGAAGVYTIKTSEYLTEEAVKQFKIPVIPDNTVLLSFKMTIGRVSISTERLLSNEAIAHFKTKDGSTLFSEYLYLFLKIYRWEQLGSTSSIVEAVNSQMIKQIEILVPPKEKLKDFKAVLNPIFAKIKANQVQIETLVSLRNNLLPKLMSGELTLNDMSL